MDKKAERIQTLEAVLKSSEKTIQRLDGLFKSAQCTISTLKEYNRVVLENEAAYRLRIRDLEVQVSHAESSAYHARSMLVISEANCKKYMEAYFELLDRLKAGYYEKPSVDSPTGEQNSV